MSSKVLEPPAESACQTYKVQTALLDPEAFQQCQCLGFASKIICLTDKLINQNFGVPVSDTGDVPSSVSQGV